MKSVTKKVICILITLIALFSINTKVSAWGDVFTQADDFISTGERSGEGKVDSGAIQGLSGYLYNILLSAGIIIAVVVATVLGIQFMTSSAEGQAKIKEMIVPFIIGCVVVFGGFAFWKIAVTIGKSLDRAEIIQEDRTIEVAYKDLEY